MCPESDFVPVRAATRALNSVHCRLHPHCKRLPPVKEKGMLIYIFKGVMGQTNCFKKIFVFYVRIRHAAAPRVNNNAADIWLRGQAVGSWAA